jgi:hypothetical protein
LIVESYKVGTKISFREKASNQAERAAAAILMLTQRQAAPLT